MAETPPDLENTIYMDTKHGRVVMKMRPDLAPNHVRRIKELVREGFYDGIVFLDMQYTCFEKKRWPIIREELYVIYIYIYINISFWSV